MNPFGFMLMLMGLREVHRKVPQAPPPPMPPPDFPPGIPPIIVAPPPTRPPTAPPRQPPPPPIPPPDDDLPPPGVPPPGTPPIIVEPPDFPPPDVPPPDVPPMPPPVDIPPMPPPGVPPPDVPPMPPPDVPPGVPPAPPTPGTKGRPLLKIGSRGPDVVEWQKIIKVAADGIFGPGTHAATVAWQRARPPLVPDGIVGPATWARAVADPTTPPPDVPIPPRVPPPQTTGRPTISQGSRGEHVIAWQKIIGVKADGIFGPGTKTATIAWQKERGLKADGIVGPATWTRAAAGDSKPPPIAVIPKPDVTVPPPWPQKLPTDLPPFPAGWMPDQPPPQAVQARAKQLLPTLWAGGTAGQRKVEKTTGRWITYRGEHVGPAKSKGVVAYRLKNPSGVAV
jgi:peptidoglycan hydrolase-like protein with peptidoglycan-binding domain